MTFSVRFLLATLASMSAVFASLAMPSRLLASGWYTFAIGLLLIGCARAIALTGVKRCFWSVLTLTASSYLILALTTEPGGAYLERPTYLWTTSVLLAVSERVTAVDVQDPSGSFSSGDPFSSQAEAGDQISFEELKQNIASSLDLKTTSVQVLHEDKKIAFMTIGHITISLAVGLALGFYAKRLYARRDG